MSQTRVICFPRVWFYILPGRFKIFLLECSHAESSLSFRNCILLFLRVRVLQATLLQAITSPGMCLLIRQDTKLIIIFVVTLDPPIPIPGYPAICFESVLQLQGHTYTVVWYNCRGSLSYFLTRAHKNLMSDLGFRSVHD